MSDDIKQRVAYTTNKYGVHQRGPELQDFPILNNWIKGISKPRSSVHGGETIKMDQAVFLQPARPRCDLHDVPFMIIPSNEMKAVIGNGVRDRIDVRLEEDASPLQQKSDKTCAEEIARALNSTYEAIYAQADIPENYVVWGAFRLPR